MRGVLSIYIFERYQSSEILIKEDDLHCHGRVISTHQLYLAVRPDPPSTDPSKIPPEPLLTFGKAAESPIFLRYRRGICHLEKHQNHSEKVSFLQIATQLLYQ